MPPYVCSTFFALACCFLSDKYNHRGGFVILASVISLIGYAMFIGSTNKHVLYGALFLQIMGAYTVAPLQSTWMREFPYCRFRRILTVSSQQPRTLLPPCHGHHDGFRRDQLGRHPLHVSAK